MIKEIINFTTNIIDTYPNIMSINLEPNKGMHVFIDIDEEGNWINSNMEKGKDYEFYDGKNKSIPLWSDCVKYQSVSDYITMNKVKKFDSKQKIHSCSPFAIAFNFNFNESDLSSLGISKLAKGEEKKNTEDKIRKERIKVIQDRIKDYRENSYRLFSLEGLEFKALVEGFYRNMDNILKEISLLDDFQRLVAKDYLRISLKSVPFEIQEELYQGYLETEIFNDEKLSYKNRGVLGSVNEYPDKKPYLKHQTSPFVKGIGQRYSREEALIMDNFKKIMSKNILPKPLPIFIHKEELLREINLIKKGVEEGDRIDYKDIIRELFKVNIQDIGGYYLLYYDRGEIKDFDFVSNFKYELRDRNGNKWEIRNLFGSKNAQQIDNVFHFQLAVIHPVFNNCLVVKTQKETIHYKYFDEIDKNYCKSDINYIQILKYRRSFYDFIYKSKRESITSLMFYDILQTSILDDIRMDEVKNNYHTKENDIRGKLNIWFSLTNNFINPINNQVMSNTLQLNREFIKQLSVGKANITTDEEYAFTVGQVVYYLLSKSKTSDRSYKRL